MSRCLDTRFQTTIFSQSVSTSGDCAYTNGSSIARIISLLPVVRRAKGVTASLNDGAFDTFVSERLGRFDLFHGVTGQCLKSIQRAKKLGAATILDSVTFHIDDFGEAQDRECAKFGIQPAVIERARERMRGEYECADAIRVMSTRARDSFVSRGIPESKVCVVPPFFNIDEFPLSKRSDAMFRVSFVGLIEPWKGFHYLIEAFQNLRLPDSELVIWGGTGSRAVRRYMDAATARTPNVILRPVEVRSVGYGNVYGDTSVLVLPSLADGFGFVVAEAMACGVPAIVTEKTGAADLIEDGVSGYIIPAGDSSAIAERLEYLKRYPKRLESMGSAARIAVAAYTLNATRRYYDACLSKLSIRSHPRIQMEVASDQPT